MSLPDFSMPSEFGSLTDLQKAVLVENEIESADWNGKSIKELRRVACKEGGLYDVYTKELQEISQIERSAGKTTEQLQTLTKLLQETTALQDIFIRLKITECKPAESGVKNFFFKLYCAISNIFSDGVLKINDNVSSLDEKKNKLKSVVQQAFQNFHKSLAPTFREEPVFTYLRGENSTESVDLLKNRIDSSFWQGLSALSASRVERDEEAALSPPEVSVVDVTVSHKVLVDYGFSSNKGFLAENPRAEGSYEFHSYNENQLTTVPLATDVTGRSTQLKRAKKGHDLFVRAEKFKIQSDALGIPQSAYESYPSVEQLPGEALSITEPYYWIHPDENQEVAAQVFVKSGNEVHIYNMKIEASGITLTSEVPGQVPVTGANFSIFTQEGGLLAQAKPLRERLIEKSATVEAESRRVATEVSEYEAHPEKTQIDVSENVAKALIGKFQLADSETLQFKRAPAQGFFGWFKKGVVSLMQEKLSPAATLSQYKEAEKAKKLYEYAKVLDALCTKYHILPESFVSFGETLPSHISSSVSLKGKYWIEIPQNKNPAQPIQQLTLHMVSASGGKKQYELFFREFDMTAAEIVQRAKQPPSLPQANLAGFTFLSGLKPLGPVVREQQIAIQRLETALQQQVHSDSKVDLDPRGYKGEPLIGYSLFSGIDGKTHVQKVTVTSLGEKQIEDLGEVQLQSQEHQPAKWALGSGSFKNPPYNDFADFLTKNKFSSLSEVKTSIQSTKRAQDQFLSPLPAKVAFLTTENQKPFVQYFQEATPLTGWQIVKDMEKVYLQKVQITKGVSPSKGTISVIEEKELILKPTTKGCGFCVVGGAATSYATLKEYVDSIREQTYEQMQQVAASKLKVLQKASMDGLSESLNAARGIPDQVRQDSETFVYDALVYDGGLPKKAYGIAIDGTHMSLQKLEWDGTKYKGESEEITCIEPGVFQVGGKSYTAQGLQESLQPYTPLQLFQTQLLLMKPCVEQLLALPEFASEPTDLDAISERIPLVFDEQKQGAKTFTWCLGRKEVTVAEGMLGFGSKKVVVPVLWRFEDGEAKEYPIIMKNDGSMQCGRFSLVNMVKHLPGQADRFEKTPSQLLAQLKEKLNETGFELGALEKEAPPAE